MSKKLNLDFETRSLADIKTCGGYRYAEDPSTEVLIVAVSVDGGPIYTWDITQKKTHNKAIEMIRYAVNGGWEIHAFNAQFEWAILKYVCPKQFNTPIPNINNMRCTAAVSRSAGLPPSLAAVSDFLKTSTQKAKIGSLLINRFSKPLKGTTDFLSPESEDTFTLGGEKTTGREAFQMFVEYCEDDVRTEMAVADTLKDFTLKGDTLANFQMDMRMNDRGVPVDVPALENANQIIKDHSARLREEYTDLTGLDITQNVRNLEWFKSHGYRGDSLNKETREKNLTTLEGDAAKAFKLLSLSQFVAIKKIPAMLRFVMSDGVIRGSFMWYGAQKTGRWTSKGVQWQNMKKPSKPVRQVIEEMYGDVREGMEEETFDSLYGNTYEMVASLCRYFVRFEDQKLYDADFASVEARILPMLIECQRILDKFDPGEKDLYVTTGDAVGVDRDTGKTLVLATQFQGGWSAVFTATGGTWPRSKCERAVALVRKENPEFPKAWGLFMDTALEALDNPGTWFSATKYVKFGYTNAAPYPRLTMRLPSGRKIHYPLARKEPLTMIRTRLSRSGEPDKFQWTQAEGQLTVEEAANYQPKPGSYSTSFHTYEITFYGHVKGTKYGRVKTYGGDLLQSCTQGTGVDLLSHGVRVAEEKGYKSFFVVHDQGLAKADKGSLQGYLDALCEVPDWFKGFPLEADGCVADSYSKS
tara:strand:- start:3264 stop:5354 length:2091 start_codon:yes stop_codon:yes gene_type:complete